MHCGAYASGASVAQEFDRAHESHDKGRLQSVYTDSERCIALMQQPDMIRDSTLFHWWPRQRATK